jgi:hypothetical protein
VLPFLCALVAMALTFQPKVLHLALAHPTAQAAGTAPTPNWLPADKQGFGTSRTLASKVWFTLEGGELSEVYSGQPGFAPGTPTFSATPLAWSHAQFIRLAWSIAAGRPVEQPAIVACRYVLKCG